MLYFQFELDQPTISHNRPYFRQDIFAVNNYSLNDLLGCNLISRISVTMIPIVFILD